MLSSPLALRCGSSPGTGFCHMKYQEKEIIYLLGISKLPKHNYNCQQLNSAWTSLCQPAPGKNLVSDPKSGSDVTDSGADATGAATGAWGGGADGGNASAMKVVTQCP